MFDPNPKDVEFAARQLANSHSHITYEQALEDMWNSAYEKQGDLQYNMLQAIGAIEVNDFMPDAIISSPKEEKKFKPVEEMTLDELWPPEKQLSQFLLQCRKTSILIWTRKTFPFHDEIIGRITDWLDVIRPYMGDSVEETLENLSDMRRSFLSFGLDEKDADRVLLTLAVELHKEQREHETIVTTHLAGGARDLSTECLDNQRGKIEPRDWYHQESDVFEWAAKVDETHPPKLPKYNGEHLAKNKQEGMEYHTKTQRWLSNRSRIMDFLRKQINNAAGNHQKQAKLLNLFRYCRNEVEQKRKEICRLRFGFKTEIPEAWMGKQFRLPRDWKSFKNKGFLYQPTPKLNAHYWAMLMNQANRCLGINKFYDLPNLKEF